MKLIETCNEALEDLKKRYSEPHRYYHTLDHIAWMQEGAAQVSHLLAHPIAIDFAIWYHDAVYNTRKKDNELRSADLFLAHHGRYLSEFYQGYVVDLILATIDHRIPRHKSSDFNNDCALFLDLDLMSLGFPWEKFIKNSNDIRKEYSHVPDVDFDGGRAKILTKFLERDPMYFSPYFQNYYGEKAIKNLKRSIEELTGTKPDIYRWI